MAPDRSGAARPERAATDASTPPASSPLRAPGSQTYPRGTIARHAPATVQVEASRGGHDPGCGASGRLPHGGAKR